MGRRKSQSLFEDLIGLVSALPPWAGFALAPIGFLVLHPFAKMPAATAVSTNEFGVLFGKQIGAVVAMGGQYILPLICVLGAIASLLKRRHRARLAEQTTSRGVQSALLDLS
ncbi:MAG: hypothetical protein H0V34_14180 [Gammaproteobacteria bacterium]|nr:hypothetical protein [Gammaproteobacteria bacterium]